MQKPIRLITLDYNINYFQDCATLYDTIISPPSVQSRRGNANELNHTIVNIS